MSAQRDQIRGVLNDLVSRQDPALSDPAAVERLLQARFVGILHQEIAAVKAGLTEKVPWNLRKNNETMATRRVIQDLGSSLARKHGVTMELATWVIESWALSLRMTLEPAAKAGAAPGQAQPPVALNQGAPEQPRAAPSASPGATPQTAASTATSGVSAGVPAQIVPTTRMGLIYGIDDRGSVRIFQVWWRPQQGSESASALATQVKPDQPKSSSFFSSAPVVEKARSAPPTSGPAPQAAAPQAAASQNKPVAPATVSRPVVAPVASRPVSPPAAPKPATPRPAPVAPTPRSTAPVAPAPVPAAPPPSALPPRIPSSKGEELYDKAMMIIADPKARARIPEAIQCLQQAVTQGYLLAETRLGEICLRGRVVKEDLPVAIRWLRSAAQKGEVEAQTILGSLYQCGIGVPLDLQEAQKWLQLAAKQGNTEARQLLQQILES